MPKRPRVFGVDLDGGIFRQDSQVIPVPRVSIPMPKVTSTAAPAGKEASAAGKNGEISVSKGAKNGG